MKSFDNGRITDELLSAYIDNAVSEHERNLVDAAVAADAEVAWRLGTLQQTVEMVRSLPELALPRSFAFQESQLMKSESNAAEDSSAARNASWAGRMSAAWRGFWQSGSFVYRNLAAASFVILLVFLVGNTLVSTTANPEAQMVAPAQELAFGEAPPAGMREAYLAPSSERPAQDRAGETEQPRAQPAEASVTGEAALGDLEAVEAAADQAGESTGTVQPVTEADVLSEPAEGAELPPPTPALLATEPVPATSYALNPLTLEPRTTSDANASIPAPMMSAASAGQAPPGPAEEAAAEIAAVDSVSAQDEEVASSEAESPQEDSSEEIAVMETTEAEAPISGTATGAAQPAEVPAARVEVVEVTPPQPSDDRASTDSLDETVAAAEAESRAALPTASLSPTLEPEEQIVYPAPRRGPGLAVGALDPFSMLTIGLLAFTMLFGSLWWRSRPRG